MPEQNEPLADGIPGACKRLGLCRTSLYAEIRAGRLRAKKAQGRTLITVADQVAWLDSLPAIQASKAA